MYDLPTVQFSTTKEEDDVFYEYPLSQASGAYPRIGECVLLPGKNPDGSQGAMRRYKVVDIHFYVDELYQKVELSEPNSRLRMISIEVEWFPYPDQVYLMNTPDHRPA